MDEQSKETINRIIVELAETQGEVLLIKEVVRLAKDEGISEKDVKAEIESLIEEGMLIRLDDTSVEVDM